MVYFLFAKPNKNKNWAYAFNDLYDLFFVQTRGLDNLFSTIIHYLLNWKQLLILGVEQVFFEFTKNFIRDLWGLIGCKLTLARNDMPSHTFFSWDFFCLTTTRNTITFIARKCFSVLSDVTWCGRSRQIFLQDFPFFYYFLARFFPSHGQIYLHTLK